MNKAYLLGDGANHVGQSNQQKTPIWGFLFGIIMQRNHAHATLYDLGANRFSYNHPVVHELSDTAKEVLRGFFVYPHIPII